MTEQQLPDKSVAAGRVRRLQPQARHVMIPLGVEALIVRAGEPGRTLPGGTSQRVRRRLQPTPELYLFPTAPAALHLWLTDLTSADGLPVNLGWRVQVQIADVRPQNALPAVTKCQGCFLMSSQCDQRFITI